MSYEISIARKLYKDKDGKEIRSSDFNFFYYIGSLIIGIFDKCSCAPNWKKTQNFM